MTTTMTDLQTGRTFVFNEALPGRDAYEEALAQGFTGDRAAWLAHLRGFAFDPASPDWEVDHAYAANAAVRHTHKLWVAVTPNTGTVPGSDPDVWQLLLDGEDAQALADAVAAALGHQQGAATAQGAAEGAEAGAAALLSQTQAAAEALSPIEVLHPVALPIPAGWWDTRDRVLTGASARAIISNWWPQALLPDALWRGTLAASVFDAATGGAVADPGDNVGRIEDQSGNGVNLIQASTSLRPKFGRRPASSVRNALRYSEQFDDSAWNKVSGAVVVPLTEGFRLKDDTAGTNGFPQMTQAPAMVAGDWTFWVEAEADQTPYLVLTDQESSARASIFDLSDGSIGSQHPDHIATVTPLGGGRYRCAITFTRSGGGGNVRVQLTDSRSSNSGTGRTGLNSVILYRAQLEPGAAVTNYQATTSEYDISEAGVPDVTYVQFDLVNDTLASDPIPSGLTGQAFVVGDGGCYVSDVSIGAAGTFEIGRTDKAWTGASPGLLRAVTDDTGRMLDAALREGTFTEEEIQRLEMFYKAQGGKGLLVPQANLVTDDNADFSGGLGDWTDNSSGTSSIGQSGGGLALTVADDAARAGLDVTALVTAGAWHVVSCDVLVSRASGLDALRVGSAAGISQAYGSVTIQSGDTAAALVFRAPGAGSVFINIYSGGGTGGPLTVDNLSLTRLINREDL